MVSKSPVARNQECEAWNRDIPSEGRELESRRARHTIRSAEEGNLSREGAWMAGHHLGGWHRRRKRGARPADACIVAFHHSATANE